MATTEAPLAGHQAAILHPAQVLRQAALLPAQQPAEFERPQPAFGRLREMGQDLVVGAGQPAPVAQLPLEELRQPVLHLYQAAPGLLFSLVQPPRLGHARHFTVWLTW
jgi:hypothetical protein